MTRNALVALAGALITVLMLVMVVEAWVRAGAAGPNLLLALLACAVGLTGLAVLAARPANRSAAVLCGMAAAAALGAATIDTPTAAAILAPPALWLAVAPVTVLLLEAPEGRLVSRRWRPCLGLAWAGVLVPAAALAAISATMPGQVLEVLRTADLSPSPVMEAVVAGTIGGGAAVVALLAGLGCVLFRWSRASGQEWTLLRLVALAASTALLGFLLGRVRVPSPYAVAAVVLGIVLLAVVLRDRRSALPAVVERAAAWLASAAIVTGIVTVLLALVPAWAEPADGPTATTAIVVAVLVTVVLAEPVRHTVLRLLRGHDRSPARVSADAAPDVATVLRASVETIADVLNLRYLALEVSDGQGMVHTAVHGCPTDRRERFDVVHRDLTIGAVEAAARRSRLDRRERARLLVLAGSAAVTARAVDLTDTLHTARELLVHAREEERLRLRRDLTGEVSPALTGTQVLARSLLRGTPSDDERPALEQLDEFISSSLAHVSRVVDGLRPPVLDGGLGPAVRAETARLTPDGPPVAIDTDDIADLPAAVEVCLYQVTIDTVAAVVDQGDSTVCRIRLHRSGDGVALTVLHDGTWRADGPGSPGEPVRARVDELRGRCSRSRLDSGGTRLDVWLPLRPPPTPVPTPAPTAVPDQRDASPVPDHEPA